MIGENWAPMMKLDVREKFAFLTVGVINAGCFLALASVLGLLGVSTPLSAALSYAICIAPGYLGQRALTFRSNRRHATASTRYVAVQIVGLGITTITAFVVSAVPGIPAPLPLVIAAGTAALASYLLQKLWVF